MPEKKRILFVSGEIAPFVKVSPLAELARALPAVLQEAERCDPRVMMPRYGKISERKNRLHEVIRLSGTAIPVGQETETLRVKVASIPGIRLQVYFMDNSRFFKKKAIYTDASGKMLKENPQRALFFARSVLETLRKLGWSPDIVHVFSWMSGFIPYLIRTEYAEDALFRESKIIFTPDVEPVGVTLPAALAQQLDLPESLHNRSFEEIARLYADVVSTDLLGLEGEELQKQAEALYQAVLDESNVLAIPPEEGS